MVAQVTFIVNEVPENHNYEKSIYISGDFEGWSGGSDGYKLQQQDSIYSISLPQREDTILFKFTLGTWQEVERDEDGNQTDNRSYKFEKNNDTVFIKIASWDVQGGGNKSTATKNVSIVSEIFKIPQLKRERRVWIYLPPGYANSNERYPVLYMHDGQNLFDTVTSYSGEWQVDEALNSLFRTHNFKLIVVGIDNGDNKRLDEYSPWKNEKYGGGEGDTYLEFIVQTLKPYIDTNYKSLKDRTNTGIMGSSMGGLISHYGALKYPGVFGKVGVYSPSFWFAPQINAFTKRHGKLNDTQFYFLAGGKEGTNTAFNGISKIVQDMNDIVDLLKNEGVPSESITSKMIPEGEHNEALWRTNFKETVLWLFPDARKQVRTFKSAAQTSNNTFKIDVSDGIYTIKFYNEEIVETTFVPQDEQFEKESHAVILKPGSVKTTPIDSLNFYNIATSGISVTIQKQPFNISYDYKGKKIISEKNGYRKIDDLETIQFDLDKSEVLYGGGARALGMDRRGHRLRLYNKADYGYEERSKLLNYTMPLAISSKKYMIHFDNAPIGFLDLDSHQENTLAYETISGRKTYQLVVGDNWYDLMDNYTKLTGKQPMPPRWALGNFSSRFGYRSEKETRRTIDLFKKYKIPVDAVILDIFWFGKDIKGHMGNFEFFKDSFPNPKKMIADFKDQNIKTVLITEPFVLTTSKKWQDAVDNGVLALDSLGQPYTYDFYFGNTGLIDIYKPRAKQWFWNIYKDLAKKGVAGVWGDLGEPEVHPPDVIHETGTADEVHNIYGHDWARLVYEGYQHDFPNQRPFILMRAGYSGSQRFGLIPWSGDVSRSWGGLKPQPEIALQMGMQGLAYMHSDLGGFAGDTLDDELYSRWLQYGVFQPIFRPHAQEMVPSEPVFRSDSAKALAKKAIELRYRLLPYNYNLVYENNQKGTPLMRPIFFEEQENDSLQTYNETYLWGNDILVSPILESGKEQQKVYFPKGFNWYDFYTGEKHKGGIAKDIQLQKEHIPTFIRSGTFLPMARQLRSTEDYDGSKLIIHYYYDESIERKSEQVLYNDDGKTAKPFEDGAYELLKFKGILEDDVLKIKFEIQLGEVYKFREKEIDLVIHHLDKKPKNIQLNKKKLRSDWNPGKKTLTIPIQWKAPKEIELKIKL